MSRPKKTTEENEEKKVESPLTLAIDFLWLEAKPDNRQYRQNSIVLNPSGVNVSVNVPLKPEYIANSAEVIKFQLDQGGTPLPVLTPKGLRYCMDELDKEFQSDLEDEKEETPIAEENLEWDDTPKDTKTNIEPDKTNETEWSDEEEDTDNMNESDFQWDD